MTGIIRLVVPLFLALLLAACGAINGAVPVPLTPIVKILTGDRP